MGTTAAALAAGDLDYVLVVAIEGFPYLLTNAADAGMINDAWAGTDFDGTYNDPLTGLFIQLRNQQAFDPWNPLQGGGALTISVVPDSQGDILGVAMAQTDTFPETQLTATLDRAASTVHVQRTADFATPSNFAYVGNECFSYNAVTATTFTVGLRSMFSPFGPTSSGAVPERFGQEHRVGAYDQFATLAPLVTQKRRTWKGALVGVWMHRVVAGVADVKAQAQCIWAGKIDEFADDDSGNTVIKCRHVLDLIAQATLGRDQYRATINSAIYLPGGTIIAIGWDNDGALRTANNLSAVVSGAVAPDTILAGYYSAEGLIGAINTWFDAERSAGRLGGYHSIAIVQQDPGTASGAQAIQWTTRFSAAASVTVSWSFKCGPLLEQLFGTFNLGAGTAFGSTTYQSTSVDPLQSFVGSRFQITQSVGTFFDQKAYLPAQYSVLLDPAAAGAGLFLVGGKNLFLGEVVGGELVNASLLVSGMFPHNLWQIDVGWLGGAAALDVVQVFAISRTFNDLMQLVFKSTGTTGYNDSTWDELTSGLGMCLPGELFLDRFDNTLAMLPGTTIPETMWIVKPTTFADIFTADLVLRGAHLVWRNGGIEWQVWSTPTAATATVTLTEANKAEPAGHVISQRTVALTRADWAKGVVKVNFDYDAIGDKYNNVTSLEDPVAIDDQGGTVDPVTLNARNFGTGQDAIDAIQLLLGGTAAGDIGFVAKWIPFASRPVRVLTRSIAPSLYEGIAPGDVAIVSDSYARDPSTGLRGTTARPGLILSHSADLGGLAPGARLANPPAGEIDVMVMPQNRVTIWSPAAELDETVSGGGFTAGYNSGTLTMTCKAHAYSEASETADASGNFQSGDAILITEIDPDAVSAPLQWQRTIAAAAGNNITVTAALASPAFDGTKLYRITSALYTSAQATQETDAYQASSANRTIQTTSPAYQYGLAPISISAAGPNHTDPCENIPNSSWGDGAAADTGSYRGICKTINNLIDHRGAKQTPSISTTLIDNKTGAAGYLLRWLEKKFFGVGNYGGAVKRKAYVSLWLRKASGGSTTARVTLARDRIIQPYKHEFTAPSTEGYVWTGPISQATWTVSSTTWATTAEMPLDLSILDDDGCAWLAIELANDAECRGVAELIVRERTS